MSPSGPYYRDFVFSKSGVVVGISIYYWYYIVEAEKNKKWGRFFIFIFIFIFSIAPEIPAQKNTAPTNYLLMAR